MRPAPIDLDYRPRTYFRPRALEAHLLSQVKTTALRRTLQQLFAQGRHDQVRDLLTKRRLSEHDRALLETFHPMFMGGNYLPEEEDGEVEIARVNLRSTTYDATCVYARSEDGRIRYRVVDEYGGDTLQGPAEARSDQPMTLREFADFFFRAWPLIDVIESNFEDDLAGALGFFSVESEFYPELDRLCRQRVRERIPATDTCPVCDHPNSRGEGDTCEHFGGSSVRWKRGRKRGVTWTFRPELMDFLNALRALSVLIEAGDDSEDEATVDAFARVLRHQVTISRTRADLIAVATSGWDLENGLDYELLDLLEAEQTVPLEEDLPATGWDGNLYLRHPERTASLIEECRALIAAWEEIIQDRKKPEGNASA